MPLAVRGGGHNVAGTAVCDDGVVVDLSAMRGVRIDASRRTVHVQGGATWGDVDDVTAPLGLATPGGVVSETGVAGLALSGGVSHQRRRDGMTVDNLVSAEVVLADGRRVRASADEHADLYWALRGGGGNFGVVTSFELRLHELGPEVFTLNVAYPLEDAVARARRLARRRGRRTGRTVDRRADLVAAGRRRPAGGAARPALRRHRRHVGGRPGRGRARHAGSARAGGPAGGHERAHGVHRLPALARPVLPRGPAALLEGALPGRVLRRRDRHHRRLVGAAPVERHAHHHPPLRRGDLPRRAPRRPPSAIGPRSGC